LAEVESWVAQRVIRIEDLPAQMLMDGGIGGMPGDEYGDPASGFALKVSCFGDSRTVSSNMAWWRKS
jgi:hypothetical protein